MPAEPRSVVEVLARIVCCEGQCRAIEPDICACWKLFREHGERDLAALRDAGFVVVPGWKPMETAPKNGTPVLLLFIWANDSRPSPCVAQWQLCNDRWGWWTTYGRMVEEPTHWMPLPAAPAVDAEPGERA